MDDQNILRAYITSGYTLGIELSPSLLGLLLLVAVVVVVGWWLRRPSLTVVRITLDFAGIGTVELTPSVEDIQIAHRIWTELVTRKAAIPIDPELDVISEVYDSWYALFGRVRSLIADLPAPQLRSSTSTQDLVRIAVAVLNVALRPHLTKWHARYRNWYSQQSEPLKTASPQEVQRNFPAYAELTAEVQVVNSHLIQYAEQLQKVVHGK